MCLNLCICGLNTSGKKQECFESYLEHGVVVPLVANIDLNLENLSWQKEKKHLQSFIDYIVLDFYTGKNSV